MTETTDDLVKRLRRVSMDLGIPSTTTLDSKVVAQAADRIETLEAKLAKAKSAMKELAYWFDTDREILDAMSAECRADHERQVAKINRTLAELTGGKDD